MNGSFSWPPQTVPYQFHGLSVHHHRIVSMDNFMTPRYGNLPFQIMRQVHLFQRLFRKTGCTHFASWLYQLFQWVRNNGRRPSVTSHFPRLPKRIAMFTYLCGLVYRHRCTEMFMRSSAKHRFQMRWCMSKMLYLRLSPQLHA